MYKYKIIIIINKIIIIYIIIIYNSYENMIKYIWDDDIHRDMVCFVSLQLKYYRINCMKVQINFAFCIRFIQ